MYAWLADALSESAAVVTANRRLARTLIDAHATHMAASGVQAWVSPEILSVQDWLVRALSTSSRILDVPGKISSQQSQILWERCLRREVRDSLINVTNLARQSRETWQRLHEWMIPFDDCDAHARGPDQRAFVKAARQYLSILERERWMDDAQLPDIFVEHLHDGNLEGSSVVTFAGFDRYTPRMDAIRNALQASGCDVHASPGPDSGKLMVANYESPEAELRAAGRWARDALEQDPDSSVAIVVSGLENKSTAALRLVREGCVPGWQYAGNEYADAVNISYGRALGAYPGIQVALLILRWLSAEIGSKDIGTLLRTHFLGVSPPFGRSKLELRLRNIPDRSWSPGMVIDELEWCAEEADASDWIQRLQGFATRRGELQDRTAPSIWAQRFAAVLKDLGWPGQGSLASAEFQLVNRWRDLLNDLARLDLVSPSLSCGEAFGRLAGLAADTIYQPESETARVQVLGPLEAAGAEFDHLWVSGLTAANWPPAGRPSPLLSRELQRKYKMPDSEPSDTLEYASRVLSRLLNSAPTIMCSFALVDADTDQVQTPLLAVDPSDADTKDPGWFARHLTTAVRLKQADKDLVPVIGKDEVLSGGASTIQRQISDPFSAFVSGRLAARQLQTMSYGMTPLFRGNLIHDAVLRFYKDKPSQADMRQWSEKMIVDRALGAANGAVKRFEKTADAVLRRLLRLESDRIASLLQSVIAIDLERAAFTIDSVEGDSEGSIAGIRLRLRHDRVDRDANGSIVVIDYKTGNAKKFLNRERRPHDLQLVVYSMVVSDPIAGLALFNIDPRHIGLDGAGPYLKEDEEFTASLAEWQQQVVDAAAELAAGDVRINPSQTAGETRLFGLLSRFVEFGHVD